ncbi:hypothetical protein HNP84_005852 [Thermocatellispora tengchongensis]|uniref:Uncharacterized protein n=1 Tax=Thermocatellispora tengchongensis TaxID=1073253 RepID=A0A840P8W2_9ACTN|nr:hypothetical protein [Thermocatellispora tengchongensis]MBB5136108.1 hypothetical protein [Thermocatellispora tengchongensis]
MPSSTIDNDLYTGSVVRSWPETGAAGPNPTSEPTLWSTWAESGPEPEWPEMADLVIEELEWPGSALALPTYCAA